MATSEKAVNDAGYKMDVTVVIVTWNSSETIAKCLSALAKQSVQSFKTILIDNESSDNTVEIARSFPNVSIIKAGYNSGFAAANNFALKECKTKYIALLNPDAYPESDWLLTLLASAKKHTQFVAFGSKQLCEEYPTILDGTGDAYHYCGLNWRIGHGRSVSKSDAVEREIFSPCAAAALYLRSTLVEAGGFDEDFFCYSEDMDLGFRLRLAGHRAMYVPNAIVYHTGSASTGGQHSDFSVYHGHRNLTWTFIKNMPGPLFWIFLPHHILLGLITILTFSKQGKGKVILRAKRDAIKGIPRMWEKRKIIQAKRKASLRTMWHNFDKQLIPLRRRG